MAAVTTSTRRTTNIQGRVLRTDIQALRALAVLFVVFNHLWPKGFTGGFVGVDVFFVISGFLITSHLHKELGVGKGINLPRFYARRARRLLPAALFVTLNTLLLTVLFLPGTLWKKIAFEGFAATAYFQNWAAFSSATDYFSQGLFTTPFQHYWSLSVEEQFYLLWPVLLGGMFVAAYRGSGAPRRAGRGRHRQQSSAPLAGMVLVVAVASLCYSEAELSYNPTGAYFNTFGRAWEFGLGALVGLFHRAPWRLPGWCHGARVPLQAIGWLALFACGFTYNQAVSFPGTSALVPTLATAVIIAAGPQSPRVLSAITDQRIIQRIGDLSYSLYLWHWPIIIVAPFALKTQLGTAHKLAIVLVGIGLAHVTKILVEDPGQRSPFLNSSARRTLGIALATVVGVAVLSGMMASVGVHTAGTSNRNSLNVYAGGPNCFGATILLPENASCPDSPFAAAAYPIATPDEAPWDGYPAECAVVNDIRIAEGAERIYRCDFGGGQPHKSIKLIGDSHAEHWAHAFINIARENKWVFTFEIRSACSALPIDHPQLPGTDPHKQMCIDWARQVAERTATEGPDLVLFSSRQTSTVTPGDDASGLKDKVASALRDFETTVPNPQTRFVVLKDIPSDGPRLGPACTLALGGQEAGCVVPLSEIQQTDYLAEGGEQLADSRLSVVTMDAFICPSGQCSGVIGGVPVFFDEHHLSRTYARSLSEPLARALSDAIGEPITSPLVTQ